MLVTSCDIAHFGSVAKIVLINKESDRVTQLQGFLVQKLIYIGGGYDVLVHPSHVFAHVVSFLSS